MALYTFDRRLRLVVFDAVERIEIALRTQIIHQMSLSNGSHWNLNSSLYKNKSKYNQHIKTLCKEIGRCNETFIDHYKRKYSKPQDPPCWMSLEVTSIGLLYLLFQNLKNGKEKKAITHHFGLSHYSYAPIPIRQAGPVLVELPCKLLPAVQDPWGK